MGKSSLSRPQNAKPARREECAFYPMVGQLGLGRKELDREPSGREGARWAWCVMQRVLGLKRVAGVEDQLRARVDSSIGTAEV